VSASETNLMEKTIGSLSLHDGVVTVPTKPYEIKAIKIQFAGLAQAASAGH